MFRREYMIEMQKQRSHKMRMRKYPIEMPEIRALLWTHETQCQGFILPFYNIDPLNNLVACPLNQNILLHRHSVIIEHIAIYRVNVQTTGTVKRKVRSKGWSFTCHSSLSNHTLFQHLSVSPPKTTPSLCIGGTCVLFYKHVQGLRSSTNFILI